MIIGVLTVEYALYGNDSLKGKRRVANSLKQKVRNTFNVAIAEAGTEDSLGPPGASRLFPSATANGISSPAWTNVWP